MFIIAFVSNKINIIINLKEDSNHADTVQILYNTIKIVL